MVTEVDNLFFSKSLPSPSVSAFHNCKIHLGLFSDSRKSLLWFCYTFQFAQLQAPCDCKISTWHNWGAEQVWIWEEKLAKASLKISCLSLPQNHKDWWKHLQPKRWFPQTLNICEPASHKHTYGALWNFKDDYTWTTSFRPTSMFYQNKQSLKFKP